MFEYERANSSSQIDKLCSRSREPGLSSYEDIRRRPQNPTTSRLDLLSSAFAASWAASRERLNIPTLMARLKKHRNDPEDNDDCSHT